MRARSQPTPAPTPASAATPAPYTVLTGDCRQTLRTLPDNSVDAVVCDPPYGLSREPDVAEVLAHWLAGETYTHGASGFMGKDWDSFVPGPDYWREVYRVLKPGGHLAAFGGTRTYDLLCIALRLAGFEVRDQLDWLYGSGFPKSLDVSKAIDKQRDDSADVLRVTRWLNMRRKHSGVSPAAILAHFGFEANSGQVGHWTALSIGGQPTVPSWEQWLELKRLLGLGHEMDAEVWRLNGRKGQPGEAWGQREVTGQTTKARSTSGKSALPTMGGSVVYQTWEQTAPATDAARAWDGWGTALKPAHEPIALCRKPLSEDTVAANVLAYGTGALNVDGCRVGIAPTDDIYAKNPHTVGTIGANGIYGQGKPTSYDMPAGRWPANLLLSHAAACGDDAGGCVEGCPVAALDAQSGNKSGAHGGNGRFRQHKWMLRETEQHIEHDTGGASRFFTQLDWDDALAAATPFYYTAKASRAERNAGLDSLPQLPYQATGWSGDSMPARQDTRPGRTAQQRPQPCAANTHPTVKPVAVMAWLCRLVCPPGGVVLDPFAGSGSTGVAALGEGMRFIGCEYEPEYAAIAQARLAHAHTTPQPAAKPKPAPKAVKRATAPTPAPAPTPTPRPAKKPKVATPGASAPAGQLLLFPAAAASASA